MEGQSANLDTFLKKNLLKWYFDLKAKFMFVFKWMEYDWINRKTVAKYLKLYTTVEHILLAFPSLYMAEYGFSNVHHLLSKQRSTLIIKFGDL